jgi:hypothetical protein
MRYPGEFAALPRREGCDPERLDAELREHPGDRIAILAPAGIKKDQCVRENLEAGMRGDKGLKEGERINPGRPWSRQGPVTPLFVGLMLAIRSRAVKAKTVFPTFLGELSAWMRLRIWEVATGGSVVRPAHGALVRILGVVMDWHSQPACAWAVIWSQAARWGRCPQASRDGGGG